MQYLPLIAKVGISPTYDIIKSSFSISKSLTKSLLQKSSHKTISSFLSKTDLLHRFEMIKQFESEINNDKSKGLKIILDEIECILDALKRDLEFNKKIFIPFYKFDVEKHLPRLEELNVLLDIRFNLLCFILQSRNHI